MDHLLTLLCQACASLASRMLMELSASQRPGKDGGFVQAAPPVLGSHLWLSSAWVAPQCIQILTFPKSLSACPSEPPRLGAKGSCGRT